MFYGNRRSDFGSTDRIASFTTRKNSTPQKLSPNLALFSTSVLSSGHRLGPIMKVRNF